MVTSAHPADDDRIFFKESRSLVRAGAEVILLCSQDKSPPNKTDGVKFEVYPGGGSLRHRLVTFRQLEQAIADQRSDVIHCHEPDGLAAAVRVKRRSGAKVIFDSHELWAAVAAGKFPGLLQRAVSSAYGCLERRYLRWCDGAIGASYAISEYLSGVLGTARVATILNVPVEDVFGKGSEREWGATTVLCHDGHLTFDRGLKTMAEAIRMVSLRQSVILKIVGDVYGAEKDWLDSFIARHNLEKTILRTGWLPYTEVGRAIAPCHIGLVCLLPLPNNLVAAPNKCFNYLLYGLPVIAPAYSRSHFPILEREGCAVLADPTSPASYAEAIIGMICGREATGRLAATARMLSETKYRWTHMEPVLLGMYERVLRKQVLL